MVGLTVCVNVIVNHLNAELNPICHLLALLGAHHIFHVSGLRVNDIVFHLKPARFHGEVQEGLCFVQFVVV